MPKPELTIDWKDWDLFLKVAAQGVHAPVVAKIVTTNKKAQKYWGVLEFGSREGQRPWPEPRQRTRFGANRRVYSKQAPRGFVFRHANRFIQFLSDAYDRAFKESGGAPSRDYLKDAVNEAADDSLALIDKGVPTDSGQLRDSLKVRKAR